MMTAMTLIYGLPPILPKHPRLLILGSMPSARSLIEQQYYAHPHNLFWPLLMEIIGCHPPPTEYRSRITAAHRAGIAVWDVLVACHRNGSLDSAIVKESEQPNNIAELLVNCPSIRAVAFNGNKAQQCFKRHVPLSSNLQLLVLPSTSPANARISRAEKLTAWRQLLAFLQ